jgi:uroporphyrinogen decarboxylase
LPRFAGIVYALNFLIYRKDLPCFSGKLSTVFAPIAPLWISMGSLPQQRASPLSTAIHHHSSFLLSNNLYIEWSMTPPLLRVLDGAALTPPPVWLMRQAGRYLPEYREVRASVGGFLELCRSPDKAAEVTHQPIRRYGFDAAILFSDILVVPDALGQKVSFTEGEGPKLTPLRNFEDLARLGMDGFQASVAPVFQTVRQLRDTLPEEVALIGFCGSPWTVATYMVEGGSSKEFLKVKQMAFKDPGLFQKLIDLLVEASFDYLVGQIDHGAQVIQLFDSWAGALPELEFRTWVVEPTSKLVARLKAARPGIKIIGFPKGAGVLAEMYALETGVDAISLDTSQSLAWAVKTLSPKVVLQGNLDPILLLAGGPALDRAVDHILETTKGVPFIFNLGHGIVPPTPPENVAALMKRIRGR